MKLENLQEGQLVKVKVIGIEDKKKFVPAKDPGHKHDIIFAEWNEETSKFEPCKVVFEYLSKTNPQTEFQEGWAYWIKGGYPDPRGQRIYRAEAPAIRNQLPASIVAGCAETTQPDRPPANNPASQERNTNSVNLSGQSVTFATAYAKDLLCAKISKGEELTEKEQIDYLTRMSTAINKIMVDQIQK